METEQPIVQANPVSGPDPGVAEGAEVTNILGAPTGEVVVYDKDENGNVIGWHKEAKS